MSRSKVLFFMSVVFAFTFSMAAVSNADQALTVRLNNAGGTSAKATVTFPAAECLNLIEIKCDTDTYAVFQLQGNSTGPATITGGTIIPPILFFYTYQYILGSLTGNSFYPCVPLGTVWTISASINDKNAVFPSTCNVTLDVTP